MIDASNDQQQSSQSSTYSQILNWNRSCNWSHSHCQRNKDCLLEPPTELMLALWFFLVGFSCMHHSDPSLPIHQYLVELVEDARRCCQSHPGRFAPLNFHLTWKTKVAALNPMWAIKWPSCQYKLNSNSHCQTAK